MKRALDALVQHRGSTRAVSLIRMGIALILWARFAQVWSLGARPGFFAGLWLFFLASFHVSTALLFVGLWSRRAAAWAGIGGLLSVLVEIFLAGNEDLAHQHVYLLVWCAGLLALTPCGGSFSVDRWRAVRKARRDGSAAPDERGDLWAVRLIALQVSLIYFFGVYDKLTSPGFLAGQTMQQLLVQMFTSSTYPSSPLFPLLCRGLALSTIALELTLCFGLWFGRARPVLVPVGLVFHGVLYVVLPVSTFSVTMWVLYLAFVDPETVHRFVDELVTPARAGAT